MQEIQDVFQADNLPFAKLRNFYKSEFQELHSALTTSEGSELASKPFSKIRSRLDEMCDSLVRYHLRRLFNCIPPSYTTVPPVRTNYDHEIPDYNGCRSRVHEIICLAAPKGATGAAAADGSISSIVNVAVRRLNDFFALIDLGNSSICDASDYIDEIVSLTDSSKSGFLRGSTRLPFDINFDEIIEDIEKAHCIIAARNASEFLLSLFGWPGIQSAIDGKLNVGLMCR